MAADLKSLATRLLNTQFEELTERELKVLERLTSRRRIARNINRQMDDESDFGDRLADRVASFGGSWKFIILFGVVLMSWVSANLLLTDLGRLAFDPYPFIFLNLILSMLAAIQAPIIMMSQNRQAMKDRMAAGHDYEVNLKAELEIMQLHEKLDEVRQSQLANLLAQQARQIHMLESLLKKADRL